MDGQIRALAAVLGDGSKPPAFDTLSEVYEFAGIPFTVHEDDTVEVPTEWLVAHGFVCRGDDDWYHPTLGRW